VETARRHIVSPHDPLGSAKAFYEDRFRHDGERNLLRHQRRWLLWDGRKYGEVVNEDLRSQAWQWLANCSYHPKDNKTEPDKLINYVPTRSHVSAMLDALQCVANLAGGTQIPCWITDGHGEPSGDIIAFDNGLLDMSRSDKRCRAALLPHTPAWFSTNCLPHRYDPEARCPYWLDFLAQVFEGDDLIRALARWCGYNLTCDTRQQKFALFVGPPRSGKGTIMTILKTLLGPQNVATPSLSSLGRRFGLSPLVGKQAAIVGDGHLGRSSDVVAVLERLKSIVGEDSQDVERKGRSELTNVALKARFTVAVNELPRLPDASAALRSRMLVFPFPVSFEGREDYG
jgi:putative DNA primase/helicase